MEFLYSLHIHLLSLLTSVNFQNFIEIDTILLERLLIVLLVLSLHSILKSYCLSVFYQYRHF